MSAPRRHPAVVLEDVPDTSECVLLMPESGAILALNPTAAAVWELIDGTRGASEMAAVLVEVLTVTPEQAQQDVSALLEELAARGFLEQGA